MYTERNKGQDVHLGKKSNKSLFRKTDVAVNNKNCLLYQHS